MSPLGVGSEGRLRVKEGKGLGVLEFESEGRMRLEGKPGMSKLISSGGSSRPNDPNSSKPITSPSEAQLRSSLSSSILVPSSEGRVRGGEASRMGAGAASPSLHDHITRSPQSSRSADKRAVNPTVESISSAVSSTQVSSSPKNTPLDNPFQDEATASGANPFGDFETENIEGNPFADDYDDSKNPFADDSPNTISPDPKNPFGSDNNYDSTLNPFGE